MDFVERTLASPLQSCVWPRTRLSEGEVRGYRTAFPWGPLEVVAKTGRENPSLCLSFFPLDLISWVPRSPYSRRQGGTWEPGQVRDEGRCCALRFHKAVRIPKAESRDGNSPSCCWSLKTTGPALSGPRPQLLAPPVPSLRARRGGQGGPAPSPEPRSAPFSQGRPPACPALLAPPSPESSKFTSPGPPEATSPGAGQGHGLRGLPAGVLGSREGARRRW